MNLQSVPVFNPNEPVVLSDEILLISMPLIMETCAYYVGRVNLVVKAKEPTAEGKIQWEVVMLEPYSRESHYCTSLEDAQAELRFYMGHYTEEQIAACVPQEELHE